MNGRRTPETNNSKANKGSPLLSEEVLYQITLIRRSRGCLDRRGEKVIWEMLTENDCNLQHVCGLEVGQNQMYSL